MVIIEVSEGKLEGELVDNKYGGKYYSFKGIPYAQPPVGELRFKAPQPLWPWDGVRKATEFGPKCYQLDGWPGSVREGSEDCLYLNVYTPDLSPSQPLPVMFYIHGGGFATGSGDDHIAGPEFLIKKDVILVTINYRLEVLGFLCLHTEDIPGNAGMKDQVQALRWVNKNIAAFGGDPKNITIFGESAGAACVTYHLISPMTKGLFKRAIAQSGTCVNHWAQSFNPRHRALALARKLGCYSEDDKELYDFFKKQLVENLVQVPMPVYLAEAFVVDKIDIYFNIVSEQQFGDNERFFYGDVIDMVKNNIHDGIDIMAGFTSDEGLVLLKPGDYIEKHLEIARNYPEYFVPKPLTLNLSLNQQLELGNKIRKFYFKNGLGKEDLLEQLINFYGAFIIYFDAMQFVKFCAGTDKNQIYLFNFSCKSKRNIMSELFGLADMFDCYSFTNHADDLMYIFNCKLCNSEIDSNSLELIDNVTTIWTNFAKFGNPTPDDALGVKWLPFTAEDQDYLDIGNDLKPGKELRREEMEFWEKTLKEYGRKIFEG